jgi:hypothetical protein
MSEKTGPTRICGVTRKETTNFGNVYRGDGKLPDGRDVRVTVRVEIDGGNGPMPHISDEGVKLALDRVVLNPPKPVEPASSTEAPEATEAATAAPKKNK